MLLNNTTFYRISKDKLGAVQKWYRENGLIPRRKEAGGRVESARILSFDDISNIYHFIDNYAEDHALVLPGRVRGFKITPLFSLEECAALRSRPCSPWKSARL